MSAECLLSNGECPKTCPLFDIAEGVTQMVGTEYMREESRTDVEVAFVFRDPIHGLEATEIFNGCQLEATNPDSPTRTWE